MDSLGDLDTWPWVKRSESWSRGNHMRQDHRKTKRVEIVDGVEFIIPTAQCRPCETPMLRTWEGLLVAPPPEVQNKNVKWCWKKRSKKSHPSHIHAIILSTILYFNNNICPFMTKQTVGLRVHKHRHSITHTCDTQLAPLLESVQWSMTHPKPVWWL